MKRKVNFGSEFLRWNQAANKIEEQTGFVHTGFYTSKNPVSGKQFEYLLFEKEGNDRIVRRDSFGWHGIQTLEFKKIKNLTFAYKIEI